VKLNRWGDFPAGIKRHLGQRLLDRKITLDDLEKLRIWVDSGPELPRGQWYRDFGSFKIVGEGPNPLSFLDSEQIAFGEEILPEDEATSTTAD
jgi:hypothetical protein